MGESGGRVTHTPPNDDLSTKAGLDALDKLTEEWWIECGLDAAVAQIAAMVPWPFKERLYDHVVGLIKQSHAEGLYRGFTAGRDFKAEEAE